MEQLCCKSYCNFFFLKCNLYQYHVRNGKILKAFQKGKMIYFFVV